MPQMLCICFLFFSAVTLCVNHFILIATQSVLMSPEHLLLLLPVSYIHQIVSPFHQSPRANACSLLPVKKKKTSGGQCILVNKKNTYS